MPNQLTNDAKAANVYGTFLKNYKEVVRVAIDAGISHWDDPMKTIYPSELLRPYTFSSEEFLDLLYVNRRVEGTIKSDIRQTKDYICFVGPKGAGKTSVGRKIEGELAKSETEKIFIVFLDIRLMKKLQEFDLSRRGTFVDSLRQSVINQYLSRLFFPHNGDGRHENPKIRLWATLLQRPNPRFPEDLQQTIFNLQDEAAELLEIYKVENNKHDADYFSWLMATHVTDKKVRKLVKRLTKRITIPHLVFAARAIYGYERQLIWFDNTDALPANLQPEVVNLVEQFQAIVGSIVSTVIAIREENIIREDDPFEEPGAPPFRKRVRVKIGKDMSGHALYGPIDQPIASKETLAEIIGKRMDAARKKQVEYHEEFTEKRTIENTKWESTNNSHEKEIILKRIREHEEHLNDYAPLMTDMQYDKLKQLSKKLLKVLHEDMLIYLTNNSLREYLFIHRDFLAQVLKNADMDIDKALSYNDWYYSTLFYYWLAITERDYQIPIYNIVDVTEKWFEDDKRTIGCALHYLIITAIWNLTLGKLRKTEDGNAYKSPEVKEVVKRLESIGFSREEVIAELFTLHKGHANLRGSVVEFRSESDITSQEHITDDLKLYLTYRGRCFVSLSCNTFGYFYESIRQYKYQDNEQERLKPLREEDTVTYAGEMLHYLYRIAQMHYETLKIFRRNCSLGADDWFKQYCEWFGIPQKAPYSRSKTIGQRVRGIRRTLQFEALIAGLVRYRAGGVLLGPDIREKQIMEALQDVFDRAIKNLRRDDDPPEIDFQQETLNLLFSKQR